MAVSAFVLIDVMGNHTRSVYKTLTRIEGVRTVYNVSGPHDLIVQAEAENADDLYEKTISRIRAVDGVTKTITYFVLNT
ncbi:MAG TPA: Lrp/AsnC ligand binding domain-containing protein [Nitrospiraceae bacterium]|jgi:DNA-binding Lrp family transcriptional regulator|nr:Lrp/AsnC ligand binding domain-containing protein [Nitrospiraceae bacterium]